MWPTIEQDGGIGDALARALSAAGITPERVTAWLGKSCGCNERRERLNALGHWATRVLRGRTERAAEYLADLMGNP